MISAKANVIQPPHFRARPLVTLVDSPVAISLLQRELLRSPLGYTALAAKAQIAPSTVHNIASGTTRWPRLETIIRLLSALGWKIVAHKEREGTWTVPDGDA